jgi:hypothetical protein
MRELADHARLVIVMIMIMPGRVLVVSPLPMAMVSRIAVASPVAVVSPMAVASPVAVVSPMAVVRHLVAVTWTGVWVGHNAQDARPQPSAPGGGRLAQRYAVAESSQI